MDDPQKAAYAVAMSAQTVCDALGMLLEILQCERQGAPIPFGPLDFYNLPSKNGITHNQLLSLFHNN